MKMKPHDLDLETRKALVGRMLRSQAETGSLGETERLQLQARIEGARTRPELDAVEADLLRRLEP